VSFSQIESAMAMATVPTKKQISVKEIVETRRSVTTAGSNSQLIERPYMRIPSVGAYRPHQL
jgi:hypothetical protein